MNLKKKIEAKSSESPCLQEKGVSDATKDLMQRGNDEAQQECNAKTTSNAAERNDIALFLTSNRLLTPRDDPPKLEVTDSGKLHDQFYHALPASSAIGLLKNRWQTTRNRRHRNSSKGNSELLGALSDEYLTQTGFDSMDRMSAYDYAGYRAGLASRLSYTEQFPNASNNHEEFFSEADILQSGYLTKQGSFWKSWRRRFFILRRDIPVLAYYASQENLTRHGGICINAETIVKRTPRPGVPFCFTVVYGNRALVIKSDEGEQYMETWIEHISHSIRLRAGEQAVSKALMVRESHDSKEKAQGSDPKVDPGKVYESFLRSSRPNGTANGIKRTSTNIDIANCAMHECDIEREYAQLCNIKSNKDGKNCRRRSALLRSHSAAGAIKSGLMSDRLFRRETIMSVDDSQLRSRKKRIEPADLYNVESNARSLSLPRFRPGPSIEFAISAGCYDACEATHLLVALFAIFPGEKQPVELSRTEIQTSVVARNWNRDFFAVNFMATLSIPLNLHQMIHFEIFAATNPNSELLCNQLSLGFVRTSPFELLFTKDNTIMLECKQSKAASQVYLLSIVRLSPSEPLNLCHTYTYARRHFIAQKVCNDKKSLAAPGMPQWMLGKFKTQLDHNRGELDSVSQHTAPSTALQCSEPSCRIPRNNIDLFEADHVLVSEELSASFCSISVAAAYVKMAQTRNQRRIFDAKQFISDIGRKYEDTPSSPCKKTQSEEVINLHAELVRDAQSKLAHYSDLYTLYLGREEYYNSLFRMSEEGKEPGITGSLKRSAYKKDRLGEFMPVNLNCHVYRIKQIQLGKEFLSSTYKASDFGEYVETGEFIFPVITHGSPSAHSLGFKEGGLRRLQALHRQTPNDQRLLESIVIRQDIVYSQMLAIASAAFLTMIALAYQQPHEHRDRLILICRIGCLLSTESLLSTMGSEKGMLEDIAEASRWLTRSVSVQIVQSLETAPSFRCCKCVGVTSSDSGDQVVATFAVHSEIFAVLPEPLQQGQLVKLYSVLFTQGINEMQSVANTVMDTRLQDELNFESGRVLLDYFKEFESQIRLLCKERAQSDDKKSAAMDSDVEVYLTQLRCDIDSLMDRLTQAMSYHVQRKNVNLLIESSEICRKIGALRTTCCKSGKDRTAMSVTLEGSRLVVDQFQAKHGIQLCTAMRERGVRRINVLANTGKSKYAFNLLQVKCLPDCYRPPILTTDSHVAS